MLPDGTYTRNEEGGEGESDDATPGYSHRHSPAQVIARLARVLSTGPARDEDLRLLVYRVEGAGPGADPWGKAIFELGDGRTLGDLVNAVYHWELARGGWLLDIGIWKNLFDRSVLDKVFDLVRRGHLRLTPALERVEPGFQARPRQLPEAPDTALDSTGRNGTQLVEDLDQRPPSSEAANSPNSLTQKGQAGMAVVSKLLGRNPGPSRR